MSIFPTWQENKLFTVALSLVCLALFIFLGVKTYSSIQSTRHLDKPVLAEHTIVIEGLGKASMSPDIAVMTFGISSTAKTVSDAQKQNTASMNALIDKIKASGIASADLQTKDYSAYEKTEWNAQTQKSQSVGWIVSQSLDVKIRDVQKVSTIVEIGGQNGSTSISGPVFTIDDQTTYEATARDKALANAKKKADAIAQSLGLKIDHVVSYNEYNENTGGPIPYLSAKDVGGMMASSTPTIQSGTQELRLRVTVTYLLSN